MKPISPEQKFRITSIFANEQPVISGAAQKMSSDNNEFPMSPLWDRCYKCAFSPNLLFLGFLWRFFCIPGESHLHFLHRHYSTIQKWKIRRTYCSKGCASYLIFYFIKPGRFE